MDVVIQLPAYDEADVIRQTMRAIDDQDVPDGHTVTTEAWITRNENKFGLCDTMVAAEQVDGWDLFEAPQGKLSARNVAHNHAVEQGYDVFFSWDADAPPVGDGVLSSMIEAFEQEPTPVCVDSIPVSRPGNGLFGLVVDVAAGIEDVAAPHIHGQCHALTAEAWEALGPFDESIDQTDLPAVRAEEELGFYREVASLGPVVRPPDAQVYNDPRRVKCNVPLMDDPHCEGRTATFSPLNDGGGGCG